MCNLNMIWNIKGINEKIPRISYNSLFLLTLDDPESQSPYQ